MDPEAKRGRTREPLYAAKNTRPTRLARRKADDRARCLTAEIVAARDLDVRRQLDQTRSCAHECRRQLGIGDPKPLRTSGYYRGPEAGVIAAGGSVLAYVVAWQAVPILDSHARLSNNWITLQLVFGAVAGLGAFIFVARRLGVEDLELLERLLPRRG